MEVGKTNCRYWREKSRQQSYDGCQHGWRRTRHDSSKEATRLWAMTGINLANVFLSWYYDSLSLLLLLFGWRSLPWGAWRPSWLCCTYHDRLSCSILHRFCYFSLFSLAFVIIWLFSKTQHKISALCKKTHNISITLEKPMKLTLNMCKLSEIKMYFTCHHLANNKYLNHFYHWEGKITRILVTTFWKNCCFKRSIFYWTCWSNKSFKYQ